MASASDTPRVRRKRIYNDKRWQRTRLIVFDRDGGHCRKCGAPGDTCDHVRPVLDIVDGGGDPFDPAECQTLCSTCSGEKDGGRAHKPKPKSVNRFMRTVLSETAPLDRR